MSNFGFSQYFVNRLQSDLTATSTWMAVQGYFEDELGKFDNCNTGSDPTNLGGNAGYLQRKMCFAKLTQKELKRKATVDFSDNAEVKRSKNENKSMEKVLDQTSRKRKHEESPAEDENDSKKMKVDAEVLTDTFVWTWTDEAIYFAAPIQTPLKFTPLLPEATIKIDFDLQVRNSK